MPVSARLIANRSSFQFKNEQILKIADSLKKIVDEK